VAGCKLGKQSTTNRAIYKVTWNPGQHEFEKPIFNWSLEFWNWSMLFLSSIVFSKCPLRWPLWKDKSPKVCVCVVSLLLSLSNCETPTLQLCTEPSRTTSSVLIRWLFIDDVYSCYWHSSWQVNRMVLKTQWR